jgi:hypothetical protein
VEGMLGIHSQVSVFVLLYAVYLLYWYKITDAGAALALAAKCMHYFSDLTILCALFLILIMNETSSRSTLCT